MNTQSAIRFPIDYESLNKGDVIAADRLERIVELPRTDAGYSLKVQMVKERIEREMEAIGRPVVLAIDQGNLKVLTDSEAAIYVDQKFQEYRRRMFRQHVRGESAIDVSKLSPDERQQHERAAYVRSKEIQALARTRREVRLESHQRQTPGALPSAEEKA
jgi:hypothetical protein